MLSLLQNNGQGVLLIAFVTVLVCFVLLAINAAVNPRSLRRVVVTNAANTLATLAALLFGLIINTGAIVDIALIYACCSFISSLALLRFYHYRAEAHEDGV